MKVELDKIREKISVSWVKQSTSIFLKKNLPIGSNCELKMPLFDNNFDEFKEFGVTLDKVPKSRIQGLKRDDNKLTIKFEGGNYDFDIKHK